MHEGLDQDHLAFVSGRVLAELAAGVELEALEQLLEVGVVDATAQVGEVLAWRNLFWGLTDAMARATTPWTPGYVLPNLDYGLAYRVAASTLYPKLKEIVENVLASALETENDYDRPLAVQIAALLHVAGVDVAAGRAGMASLLDKVLVST